MPFSPSARIIDNDKLREPQREAWAALREHFSRAEADREVGVVLPVGCGKSGLIAITPLALDARRVLVLAPGARIRKQLSDDLKASSESNFFARCEVYAPDVDLPTAAVLEPGRANIDDVRNSDFTVTNIHQVAGEENRWLDQLEEDFFDLILIDEAHHNVATSWQQVKQRFPQARIVNFSATPTRADGRLMEGRIIYSFPVIRAIQAGYVKRLRAKMLRPSELRYVDRSTGVERIIGPDEVRELGESDAGFRRGIVMSDQTLGSLVDCANGELQRLKRETGERRLKIIASALNQEHCAQITEAFRSRGIRAEYVHSNEGGQANERVFAMLENHEIDVIVQARMLGEGFDHKFLGVAMVGNLYSSLSPFIQFVGRVMRVIEQGAPGDVRNQGVVVFHAGANIAGRWEDFRTFSDADQAYFAELLPEPDSLDFGNSDVVEREPGNRPRPVEVVEQRDVRATEMDPIGDEVTAELLRQLAERGITPDQAAQAIRRAQADRQDVREALRATLKDRVPREASGVLRRLRLESNSTTLDPSGRRKDFAWVTAELNRRVNDAVGAGGGERQSLTLDQVNQAIDALPGIVAILEAELHQRR